MHFFVVENTKQKFKQWDVIFSYIYNPFGICIFFPSLGNFLFIGYIIVNVLLWRVSINFLEKNKNIFFNWFLIFFYFLNTFLKWENSFDKNNWNFPYIKFYWDENIIENSLNCAFSTHHPFSPTNLRWIEKQYMVYAYRAEKCSRW